MKPAKVVLNTSMITVTEVIDSTTYTIAHYMDTRECYGQVKECAEKYWTSAPKKEGIENYQFGSDAKPWSLGPMLENNLFEGGFSVLSIDDKPWSFGGIRKYSDEVSIIGSRNFSFYTLKPITHGLLVPFQLEMSKKLGYKRAWATINDYNLYWYNTYHVKKYNKSQSRKRLNKLYTNSDECISKCKNLGKMIVFNTEQTVLEWIL
jgi:hypothetical protein